MLLNTVIGVLGKPEHPMCGYLTPDTAQSHDSLCVQFVHNAAHIGELRLNSSSAINTRSTSLPETIAPGDNAWWAVKDGVEWAFSENEQGDVHPFSFTAWYRGDCLSGCTSVGAYYDVGITVSLSILREAELMLKAQHQISVTTRASESALPHLGYEADWTPCVLHAKATITSGGPVVRAREPQPATRDFEPGAERPSVWCFKGEHFAFQKMDQQRYKVNGVVGGTRGFDLSKAPSACEQMGNANATNAVHVQYFLEQQKAERNLLDQAEAELCVGSPDEDEYQARLEALLKPYRMAARLHIHTAFLAKKICSINAAIDRQRAMEQKQLIQLPSYAEGYFNLPHTPAERLIHHLKWTKSSAESLNLDAQDKELVAQGRDSWFHLLTPYTHDSNQTVDKGGKALWEKQPAVKSVDSTYLPDQPDPDADWCPLPILHHEPFNTWESWDFWNVTSKLQDEGASFCSRPARRRQQAFETWRATLLDVQARHRNNNAFIVYTSAYEEPCRLTKVMADLKAGRKPRSAEEYKDMQDEYQTRHRGILTKELEEVRAAGDCDLANVTAPDLISAFGNDTQMALSMARGFVDMEFVLTGDVCGSLPRAQLDALLSAIGPLPADARFFSRGAFSGKWGAWILTLSTAYHKLVPMCQPADPLYARLGPDVWDCDQQVMPLEPDGKIVYDLIPMNKKKGYFYGPACRAAARGISEYRAFLHVFSRFRLNVVHALLSRQCPFKEDGEFLKQLLSLRDWLPRVLVALRNSQQGLAAACVAPSRSPLQQAQTNWKMAVLSMAHHKEMEALPDPSSSSMR